MALEINLSGKRTPATGGSTGIGAGIAHTARTGCYLINLTRYDPRKWKQE